MLILLIACQSAPVQIIDQEAFEAEWWMLDSEFANELVGTDVCFFLDPYDMELMVVDSDLYWLDPIPYRWTAPNTIEVGEYGHADIYWNDGWTVQAHFQGVIHHEFEPTRCTVWD